MLKLEILLLLVVMGGGLFFFAQTEAGQQELAALWHTVQPEAEAEVDERIPVRTTAMASEVKVYKRSQLADGLSLDDRLSWGESMPSQADIGGGFGYTRQVEAEKSTITP